MNSLFGQSVARLKEVGIDTPELEARILLAHVMEVAPLALNVRSEEEVDPTEFEPLIQRRLNHEPVARIIGEREFWGLPFMLSPATLEPRPDSETLVEVILKKISDKTHILNILDLGTGTGCLLLSLLHELPNATGVGIDCTHEAVATAQQNALNLGVADRAHFQTGDWAQGISETFDIVISNPPYIPAATLPILQREVRDFDPDVALNGGKDGLDPYRIIAAQIPACLKAQGRCVVEIGQGQAKDVTEIFKEQGLNFTGQQMDLGGIVRVLTFRQSKE